MSAWTEDELDQIGTADELDAIAPSTRPSHPPTSILC